MVFHFESGNEFSTKFCKRLSDNDPKYKTLMSLVCDKSNDFEDPSDINYVNNGKIEEKNDNKKSKLMENHNNRRSLKQMAENISVELTEING